MSLSLCPKYPPRLKTVLAKSPYSIAKNELHVPRVHVPIIREKKRGLEKSGTKYQRGLITALCPASGAHCVGYGLCRNQLDQPYRFSGCVPHGYFPGLAFLAVFILCPQLVGYCSARGMLVIPTKQTGVDLLQLSAESLFYSS